MNGYLGYIRVSTVKQGTKGVSLQEQRDAILRYAERNHLPIALWLEETETAAKQGRPVFNRALTLLRKGEAQGIILHKLDRGARNLRDWAAIGELSDQGVEVHFVTESLDLQSRGGRLSADIQAVVAADYIRNLREETRKGFYGRLKQGFYPLRAPLGYLDQGKAKAKTIDPIMGPLVRTTFELYGTGRFNLKSLSTEMHRLGLRNRNGGRVSKTGLSTLLNNPFYLGVMRIRKTAESFVGTHEPLISKALFNRVQAVLTGKVNAQTQRHAYAFRRLLTCARCEYSLIGERQKGRVYYRCHTAHDPRTTIREDTATTEVQRFLDRLRFHEQEQAYFRARVLQLRTAWASRREAEERSLNLRLAQCTDRIKRLTDAYLDQALDKPMFEERKHGLLVDRKAVEAQLAALQRSEGENSDELGEFLELAGNAWLSHEAALPEERSEMLKILTSNREVEGKNLVLEPSLPFKEIVNRPKPTNCGPNRDIPRTWDRILDTLAAMKMRGELPDLTQLFKSRGGDLKERCPLRSPPHPDPSADSSGHLNSRASAEMN